MIDRDYNTTSTVNSWKGSRDKTTLILCSAFRNPKRDENLLLKKSQCDWLSERSLRVSSMAASYACLDTAPHKLGSSQTRACIAVSPSAPEPVSDPRGPGRAWEFAALTGELMLLAWGRSLRTAIPFISQKTAERGKSEIVWRRETQAKEVTDDRIHPTAEHAAPKFLARQSCQWG